MKQKLKSNILLSSFELELYNINNSIHNDVLNELWLDDNTKKYLYGKDEFINNILNGNNELNSIYLVKKDNNYIGFVSLYYCDNIYEVCDGILIDFRNKKYSSLLLNEFTKYIFNNTDIDRLYGYIDEDNIASIKSVLNIGFVKNDEKEYVLNK